MSPKRILIMINHVFSSQTSLTFSHPTSIIVTAISSLNLNLLCQAAAGLLQHATVTCTSTFLWHSLGLAGSIPETVRY